MKITAPFFPIVFIRGFAATMSDVEESVASPYMGFNDGSTKLRQDYTGKIVRHIFESSVIRLMKDEGYVDTYQDGDFFAPHVQVPVKSIWVFRYYDQVSEDLGEGRRLPILEFARQLREFILRIRHQVCSEDLQAQQQFKVYLVAHSMGGLIARCYLQNLCVNGVGDEAANAALALPGDHWVDKVFTYGTPHNGIDVRGLNVPNLGVLDQLHIHNFNRDVMKQYLALDKNVDQVDSLNNTFPVERFFCFVGTNHRDYSEVMNLSRRVVGPMSDGLVMIKNACVQGSPRAHAHRTHSGTFGLVNSEEGYQNLRRFLFGQVRVDVLLQVDELILPKQVQALKEAGKKIRGSYNIETTARVRGVNYVLHDRRTEHESAILRSYDALVKDKKPVYLFTGYLHRKGKMENSADTALAFAVRIAIQVPLYEVDNQFWFDEYFEGGYLIDDTITFHVRPKKEDTTVTFGLASQQGMGQATRKAVGMSLGNNNVEYSIALGFNEGIQNPPRPGFRGKIKLIASPWNEAP